MDPHDFDEEEEGSELVRMRTDSGEMEDIDHLNDGGAGSGVGSSSPSAFSSSAALSVASGLASTPGTRGSAIEFNHLNVYIPPSTFQGWCGGAKAAPKHILRDLNGKLQVHYPPSLSQWNNRSAVWPAFWLRLFFIFLI